MWCFPPLVVSSNLNIRGFQLPRVKGWCGASHQISYLINVYITAGNEIHANPCWKGSRSLGKPIWVDNRLYGSCMHRPVSRTHWEGLRVVRKKQPPNYQTLVREQLGNQSSLKVPKLWANSSYLHVSKCPNLLMDKNTKSTKINGIRSRKGN